MNQIKIFCPATIANLSCGFDVLGCCLETIGDEMVIKKVSQKGIQITKIVGANLPLETSKNVAGVAAQALIDTQDLTHGFAIEIYKNIKAGSGIGSSAASAAGAVFGINELLGKPFTNQELVAFAMKGEAIASGSEHADNVAPALLGGFTLIRGYEPLDIIKIESPDDLFVTVIHPQIELKTAQMRGVLSDTVSLKQAITQWGNLGGFVAGLYTSNYDLISRSLQDVIVEPVRGPFIPQLDQTKQTAIATGALGAGISGSGPSIFALSKGIDTAKAVANAWQKLWQDSGIVTQIYVSKIKNTGVTVI